MKSTAPLSHTGYIISLVFLLAVNCAVAQIKTIIPAVGLSSLKVNKVATPVSFDLSTLPPGYKINSCQLQIVCGQTILKATGIEILSANNIKINNHRFKTTYRDTTIIKLDIDAANIPNNGGILILKIRKDSPNSDSIKIYPSTDNPSPKLGYNPQLIINYSVAMPVTEWASMHANAQHMAQSPMMFSGNGPENFESLPVNNIGGAKQNMVMYNDHLYVISTDSNVLPALYSVDPVSLSATHQVGPLDAPNEDSAPVVDAYGRFYYVSGANISVIELANKYNIQKNKLETGGSGIVNGLTIGTDGSVYVPAYYSVNAYTPFPQNQLIWQYTLAGKKSSVALSNDGTRLYVFSYKPGSKTDGLLTAIDANNGTWKHSVDVKIDADPQNDNPPAPVVDNLGFVYLTNRLINPTELYVFDERLKPVETKITGSNISMTAGLDDKDRKPVETTFINAGQLYKFSGKNKVPVPLAAIDIQEVKSLLTDEGNNTYILGGNKFIYRPATGDNIPLTLSVSPKKTWCLVPMALCMPALMTM